MNYMKTGRDDILETGELSAHVKAIVTGATSVFTRDLCKAMFHVQSMTGCEDMQQIAKACAQNLLCSNKCGELESLVAQVLESTDGMPDIQNKALLREVLQDYDGLSAAERSGEASEYRTNTLVPSIVEEAFEAVTVAESGSNMTKSDVARLAAQWDSFEAITPFQKIVVDCINRIGI